MGSAHLLAATAHQVVPVVDDVKAQQILQARLARLGTSR